MSILLQRSHGFRTIVLRSFETANKSSLIVACAARSLNNEHRKIGPSKPVETQPEVYGCDHIRGLATTRPGYVCI